MNHQGAQVVEGGSVGASSLDRVETRQLQASNQFGVDRRRLHVPMVPGAPASMEVQADPRQPSMRVQSLDWDGLIESSRTACGLTHGQMCAFMADEDGKPLDQSQWTRMRKDGNLPLKRMRNLPLMFWWHFGIGVGEAAGLDISHASIEDVTLGQTRVALHALADLLPVLMRRAG